MCQNIDEIEALVAAAMAKLLRAQKLIKEKKSKIKEKKECLKEKSNTNLDTFNTIYNIISHYQKYHPKAMRSTKKNSSIYKKIEGRLLEGYTYEEICRAIDGQHISPFHLGDNKHKTEYLQLELVVRSGEKLDMFIAIFDRPKTSTLKPKTARTLTAAQDWLSDDEDVQRVRREEGSTPVSPQPLAAGWAAK